MVFNDFQNSGIEYRVFNIEYDERWRMQNDQQDELHTASLRQLFLAKYNAVPGKHNAVVPWHELTLHCVCITI